MGKRVFNKLILLAIFFFLFPVMVTAGSVNASFSGASTVTVGDEFTVYVNVGNIVTDVEDPKMYALSGFIQFNPECIQFVSATGSNGFTATMNNSTYKMALIDMTMSTGTTGGTIGSITFRAIKAGDSNITLTGASSTDFGNNNLAVYMGSKYITIKNPPSSNNNLSSLKVSPGSISFNKNTTSYNVNVDSNVTSVNITASAEDSTARIEGTGTRNLNYGNNALAVKVIAENGAEKVYTINVNRKDNRRTNNNLSSLSVSNGKLSPGFNKNTTYYSVEVPYEVTRINISATAEDGKARVNVYSPELIAEETVNATVTVTAENGSNKTYTISIKRGKDPNKVLSTDNYLNNLSVSVGMLSPEFNREKLNYAVYLPYEVSYIVIDTEVSDTRYATVEKIENNNLSIGNNLFKYTVTAEDGSTRVYTVTVVRNKSMDDVSTNTNTYLKSLKLSNGSLTKGFNKKVSIQYYNKKNNKVNVKEAIPEVDDNTVTTYKIKGAFIIIVETPTGEKGFYILIEKKSMLLYLIIGFIIIMGITTFFIIKKNINKFGIVKENKTKKSKKSKE